MFRPRKFLKLEITLISCIFLLIVLFLSGIIFVNIKKSKIDSEINNKTENTSYFEINNNQNKPLENNPGIQNDQNKNNLDITITKEQDQVKSTDIKNTESQFKPFTGAEFMKFYDSFVHPKATKITQKPVITGNPNIDNYIQQKAETRGYKLRYLADPPSLVSTGSEKIQADILPHWLDLQKRAEAEGIKLVLVSGYRSIDLQRQLFISSLNSIGYTESSIISGTNDTALDNILKTRSIPGYSKHHTGYTIDLGCNSSDLTSFKNTPCYLWMSKNNYENAKKSGFIPSYPDGAENQGPNPEEWEYVWVGVENLVL